MFVKFDYFLSVDLRMFVHLCDIFFMDFGIMDNGFFLFGGMSLGFFCDKKKMR